MKLIKLGLIFFLSLSFFSFVFYVLGWNTGLRSQPQVKINTAIQPPLNPDLILVYVNQRRSELKLHPLVKSDQLCKIANTRILEVVRTKQAQTTNPNAHKGIEKYESLYPGIWQELLNYISNTPTEKVFVDTWINSPPHEQAMDNPEYTEGCAAIDGNQAILLVGQPPKTSQP